MSIAKQVNRAEIPLAEWIIGGIGLLIVAGVVSLLIYEAVAGDKSPPDVKLTAESISAQRNGYLVKIRAQNEGGEAAAHVGIEVVLVQNGTVLETRQAEFDYLPPHSEQGGGVFFTRDPREGELRLHARGYEEP